MLVNPKITAIVGMVIVQKTPKFVNSDQLGVNYCVIVVVISGGEFKALFKTFTKVGNTVKPNFQACLTNVFARFFEYFEGFVQSEFLQ